MNLEFTLEGGILDFLNVHKCKNFFHFQSGGFITCITYKLIWIIFHSPFFSSITMGSHSSHSKKLKVTYRNIVPNSFPKYVGFFSVVSVSKTFPNCLQFLLEFSYAVS